MQISRVAVIGAGSMGSQIAQLMSQVGEFEVSITDVKPELLSAGIKTLKDNMKKYLIDKGKMTQAQMDKITERITGKPNIASCVAEADFVIEAAFDTIEVKRDIFKQADEAAKAGTILASNTSYLNITDIAASTKRTDRVVGMHFFNPVGVMKLVEVIKGPFTSKETIDTTFELAKKLGKEPVICNDFSFGFLANRAYAAMIREAVQMVWERVAPPEEIDKAVKLGYNLAMGPLELGDYTGAWQMFAISEPDTMKALGSEKGHLHPLIRMMVRAGYTGGKGKKGMYDFYKEVLSKI